MNQYLEAHISIPVPAEYTLIKKVEYKELKQQELTGVYWSMKDLEDRISKKEVWIKNNILLNPKFREQLDIENGVFVEYCGAFEPAVRNFIPPSAVV